MGSKNDSGKPWNESGNAKNPRLEPSNGMANAGKDLWKLPGHWGRPAGREGSLETLTPGILPWPGNNNSPDFYEY